MFLFVFFFIANCKATASSINNKDFVRAALFWNFNKNGDPATDKNLEKKLCDAQRIGLNLPDTLTCHVKKAKQNGMGFAFYTINQYLSSTTNRDQISRNLRQKFDKNKSAVNHQIYVQTGVDTSEFKIFGSFYHIGNKNTMRIKSRNKSKPGCTIEGCWSEVAFFDRAHVVIKFTNADGTVEGGCRGGPENFENRMGLGAESPNYEPRKDCGDFGPIVTACGKGSKTEGPAEGGLSDDLGWKYDPGDCVLYYTTTDTCVNEMKCYRKSMDDLENKQVKYKMFGPNSSTAAFNALATCDPNGEPEDPFPGFSFQPGFDPLQSNATLCPPLKPKTNVMYYAGIGFIGIIVGMIGLRFRNALSISKHQYENIIDETDTILV